MASSRKPPPSAQGEPRPSPATGQYAVPAPPRTALGTVTLLYLAVGLGSMIGGSARWLVSDLMLVGLGSGFPWGTLLVNVSGSFLIGFYAAFAGPGGRILAGPVQRHFIMTGVFGGYTTFSIFSLETIQLAEAGQFAAAGFNLTLSLITWVVAVWAGFILGRRSTTLVRR
ncbi:CrcB family protein [Thioalkalivibrio sp.]|uniref:fluoride efflux transporter FluC n=1 Tax=Thioalkalivibrio sp. TaxID=2093813 RepID=UPI0012D676F4|nr:CrcB family protein [Thioalkalivibrio sp.]TVP79387.1 MAG: chromosome condensation protein CrcB [Thioalkalivibrio sp.]